MASEELKKKLFHFLENEDVTTLHLNEKTFLKYSTEIKGTSKSNSSNVYYPQNHELNSELEKTPGFLNISFRSKYDLFCFICKYYKNKDFLGERKRELIDGKVIFGSYVFKTYEEIKNEIDVFASALYQFENIEPTVFIDNGKYNKMKIIGIWSKNRPEWYITDMASSAIDFVTVPLYDTMGINSVKYIFDKTEMKVCCIESTKLENLVSIKDQLIHLEILIIYDEWNINKEMVKKAKSSGFKIYMYTDLLEEFKNKNIVGKLYSSNDFDEKESRKKEGNKKKNVERNEIKNGCIVEDINSLDHKKNKIRKMTNESVDDKDISKKENNVTVRENIQINNAGDDTNEYTGKEAINSINVGKETGDDNNNDKDNGRNNEKKEIKHIINDFELKFAPDHCKKPSTDDEPQRNEFSVNNSNYKSELNKPNIHDVCSIIFTSGSTGLPKGVMLTHLNFLSFIQSYLIDGNRLGLEKNDSILSYLPLAHAYERYIEYAICFFGAKIGYFSGNIKEILGDINELKPTVLIAVPRILQKIYDNIMEGLKSKSFLARVLVKTAIKKKKNIYLKNPTKISHGIYDLILQPIRNRFGGALRIQVMGSSSMDNNKLIDLQMIFSTPISEGWGMSEVGIGFLQNKYDSNKGTIGGPFSNVVMKVVKVEQMKYDPKGQPNQGELCVKGSGVMVGYFRNLELTKKSFDADGFFFTGDIVEIQENGCVKIIDRAKNIFKLSQGEYVEPEKLENVYVDSSYIDQIFVHGYSHENELVSIIVPSQNSILDYAKKNNIVGSYEELLKNDTIKKLIGNELINVATKYKLNGIERVRLFHLTETPFSLENKQLTPTHKIVRPVLSEDYKNIIDDLYKNRNLHK